MATTRSKANDVYGLLKGNALQDKSANYGYSDMSGILSDLANTSKDNINRQSSYDVGAAKQGATARNPMLTGSLREDVVGNAGNNVIRNKYNALGQVEAGQQEANLNSMQLDNSNQFTADQIKNQSFSQLANFLPTLMQADNQPTWLTDLFSLLNVGTSAYGALTK